MFSKVLPAFLAAAAFCAAVGYKTLRNEAKSNVADSLASIDIGQDPGATGTTPETGFSISPARFSTANTMPPQASPAPPQASPAPPQASPSASMRELANQMISKSRRGGTPQTKNREFPRGVNPAGMKFLAGELANTKGYQPTSNREVAPGSQQTNPFVK